jgi:hypothetical protein
MRIKAAVAVWAVCFRSNHADFVNQVFGELEQQCAGLMSGLSKNLKEQVARQQGSGVGGGGEGGGEEEVPPLASDIDGVYGQLLLLHSLQELTPKPHATATTATAVLGSLLRR